MDQTPLFLTKYALTRILKEFACHLGFNPMMADAVAQTHLHISPIAPAWNKFISENCSTCEKTPDSCEFLNPVGSHSYAPDQVAAANAIAIERGRMPSCPSFVAFSGIRGSDPPTSVAEE